MSCGSDGSLSGVWSHGGGVRSNQKGVGGDEVRFEWVDDGIGDIAEFQRPLGIRRGDRGRDG